MRLWPLGFTGSSAMNSAQENSDCCGSGASSLWPFPLTGRSSLCRSLRPSRRTCTPLAHWLTECGVQTVVMESTGVPLFEVLEERGFQVMLVDPRRIKNVPGRKTDVRDSQWLQQLHSYGLLSGAFRPDGDLRRLRSYLRQRAIRDPRKLARLRDRRIKAYEATIAESLQGHWREEHIFELAQAVELYRVYQGKIASATVRLKPGWSSLKTAATASLRLPMARSAIRRTRPASISRANCTG